MLPYHLNELFGTREVAAFLITVSFRQICFVDIRNSANHEQFFDLCSSFSSSFSNKY